MIYALIKMTCPIGDGHCGYLGQMESFVVFWLVKLIANVTVTRNGHKVMFKLREVMRCPITLVYLFALLGL